MNEIFELCGCGGDSSESLALEQLKYKISIFPNFDVNTLNIKNESLLGVASMFGHLEIVKYLIKNHSTININSAAQNRMTPLMWACFMGNLNVVKFCILNFQILSILMQKLMNGLR